MRGFVIPRAVFAPDSRRDLVPWVAEYDIVGEDLHGGDFFKMALLEELVSAATRAAPKRGVPQTLGRRSVAAWKS